MKDSDLFDDITILHPVELASNSELFAVYLFNGKNNTEHFKYSSLNSSSEIPCINVILGFFVIYFIFDGLETI